MNHQTNQGEHGVALVGGDRLWFSAMEKSGDGWDLTLLRGGTLHVMEDDIIQRPEKKEGGAKNVTVAAVTEPKKAEVPPSSVPWLRGCELCNTGLCKEMTRLTDPVEKGGMGLPVREAAKRLEEQGEKQIGEAVWTAEQIRARYLYHTGQMDPGRKPTTAKKVNPSITATRSSPPPDPATKEDSDPLYQLKRWWMKAGKRDRANFVMWMKSSEAWKNQRKQNG